MKKKYQVFVSSTYEDLQEERKAVSQTLLEFGCIPAGMELFPASNKKSWDIIKKVIDDSDYYLLIIGCRYGSTRNIRKKVLSYTEMEYNYAQKIHKPIIAFISSNDIKKMPFEKVDSDLDNRARLELFKEKVKSSSRNVAFWSDTGSLVSKITTSLKAAIEDSPQSGWVKCADLGIDGSDSEFEKVDSIIGRWGVDKIFRTRAEKNYESDRILESHNIKQLDGIAFGLRSFRIQRTNDIISCLKNGANIRLLVMNPLSKFAIQRAREEHEVDDSIAKSIEDLINWARDINSRSKSGSIQIKLYNSMTLDFYWRIDDCIYVGPYLYGVPSQQTITYKFNKGGLAFEQYADYFERLWNDEELTKPI